MWKRMELGSDAEKYLRGTHTAWSCVRDGVYIVPVLLNGTHAKQQRWRLQTSGDGFNREGNETMSARERMQAAIRTYLGLGGSAHTIVEALVSSRWQTGDRGADRLDGDVLTDILSQLH